MAPMDGGFVEVAEGGLSLEHAESQMTIPAKTANIPCFMEVM